MIYKNSKSYHDKDRQMLRNEINYHSRIINELSKMPKSTQTDKDIKHHKDQRRRKTNEIKHRDLND